MTILEIIETTKKYNELLIRFLNADRYFKNPNVLEEDKEKHFPAYKKLTEGMSSLIDKLKSAKISLPDNIVDTGIELPEALKRKEIEKILEKTWQ